MVNILVANDKGGVGKSTIAQYCVARLSSIGAAVRVVDIDRQPKLHRFLGRESVTSLPFESPGMDGGPVKWDQTVSWFQRRRPLVMDFGAQVWGDFAVWAREINLANFLLDSKLTVLIPVTADVEAIQGARVCVKQARDLFSDATIVLLLSDKDGSVTSLVNVPDYKELEATAQENHAITRSIPTLGRNGYASLAAHGISFSEIERLDTNDLASIAGAVNLEPVAAIRAIKSVQAWLKMVDAVLMDLICPNGGPTPVLATSTATTISGNHAERLETTTEPGYNVNISPPTLVEDGGPFEERSLSWPSPGQMTQSEFDESFYLSANPDVQDAVNEGIFDSGFDHFMKYGRFERRDHWWR